MSAAQITVADNADRERYEIRVDGKLAGFVKYGLRSESIELVHTEINDEFEGRGLGGRLITFALDDARERGLAVLPTCPFANDYMQRHRQYVDLVPEERRQGFGL
ncbi:MAG TPA: GNAT family N-acetyltransferase [Solirubrobacterales bacterium]|nr:GNAT family N-acetyltransferase [Solirubrobacterales bacterium]